MIDILIKNLPIIIVLCPLMTSLLVVLISNIFFSWVLTTLSTFLTFLFSILLYQEIQIPIVDEIILFLFYFVVRSESVKKCNHYV